MALVKDRAWLNAPKKALPVRGWSVSQQSPSTGILMPLDPFHPAVRAWFDQSFAMPTPAQADAWPQIRAGRDVLIAAPTGSGKTLAAFLSAIDELVRYAVDAPQAGSLSSNQFASDEKSSGELFPSGTLLDKTFVLYISPLKALSNDIHKNLELPLQGIGEELARLGLPPLEITTMVRTGDTKQSDRQSMRKRAPHIVITTPESLYVLLGSESGRRMLASVRSI